MRECGKDKGNVKSAYKCWKARSTGTESPQEPNGFNTCFGFTDTGGEGDGERLVGDDAKFLVWINGEGLIIRMTDLILNTLNSRDMVDILVETSSVFLTKWVLTLANG